MKLVKRKKVGAGITDSLANLSVIGIFQTVEDAVTELWGELGERISSCCKRVIRWL